VELRQMASAFLTHQGDVLMMKKTKSRLYQHAFWAAPGGHLEPEEWNEPRAACLRELQEETGLRETDVDNLQLRYILLRRKDEEIRQQFIYWGQARTRDVRSSDEGELHWIKQERLMSLDISHVVKQMLLHYGQNPGLDHLLIGAVTMTDDGVRMQWSPLRDPLLF